MKTAEDELSKAVLRLDEALSRQDDGGYMHLRNPNYEVRVQGEDLRAIVMAYWSWFDKAPPRPTFCRSMECDHPTCRCEQRAAP